ncbi:MAG: diacylglycerol kinase family protein [Candidatus Berkelbacteria bacterium]|nr:diacylglycerol kinase family protein [Candidatus Berkelbacteria bacterium]
MYYYIFDVRKCKNRRQIEMIKDHLSDLGISGEFAVPDRIRPARELAEQGIFKGYSTIVAIGADDLIGEVASVMLSKQQVLGVIPLGASDNIYKIIEANTWEEAAENLRFRKVTDTRVGIINEQHVFFSYCELAIDHPTSVTIEFEDFVLQAKAKELFIANQFPNFVRRFPDKLDVIMKSVDPKSTTIWGRFKKAIGASGIVRDIDLTLIRTDGLRLFSPRQLQIKVDGRIAAKTPATFGISQKTIRLITKKSGHA